MDIKMPEIDGMQKQTAVILLNWNTPHHTEKCINSIYKYCNSDVFDVIVADNGSTDNSLQYLAERFPAVTFINNKLNLGFAEGNNKALLYSIEHGYTYSLVINTDTEVDTDIITYLTKHLVQHSVAAAVQPAIYWMHDKKRIWNGEGKFNKLLGLTPSSTALPDEKDNYKNAEWLTGCCMLVKNEALIKAGLFNKQFFLYYEDVELSFRMRYSGFELHYLPSCHIYHEAGVSAKIQKDEGYLSPVIHYYLSRNHFWFLRKYGNPFFYPVNLLYNLSYYGLLWCYFKLRKRRQKAQFLSKGLREGLFKPLADIY